MKVTVTVILLLLAGFSVSAQQQQQQQQQDVSNEDSIAKIRQFREQCIADTEVDPKLIERADRGDFVDDPKLKCFSKCFYQRTGYVGENGELLLDVIRARIPQEEDKDRALQVLDKCKEVRGQDSCETIYLAHKCYFLQMSGLGEKNIQ